MNLPLIDLEKKINKNFVFINIVLTYECNYNCSYCYQKEDRLKKIKNNLNKFLKDLTKFLKIYNLELSKNNNHAIIDFEFIGGELSYVFSTDFLINFKNKIEKIVLNYDRIAPMFFITTNFYRNINYYNKLLDNNFYLAISYHKEYNNFMDFVNKLKKLNYLNKINFTINYFNLEELNDYKNKLKNLDLNCKITFNKIDLFKNNEQDKNIICYAKYLTFENNEWVDFCANRKINFNKKEIISFLKPKNCNKKYCYCPNVFIKEKNEKM